MNLIVGIIGIIIVMILIFTRMQVGFAMIVVGIAGLWVLQGREFAFNIAGMIPYGQSASYNMACMPLFIFMGLLISETGMGTDLYNCAAAWLCKIKGGLAMATAVACGFFAAICGDSTTTAITMGQVAYPQMKKHNYADELSVATIAAGGTVGILIPPSICMIIYGTMTETSIGALFTAGFIPGILQVLFYVATIFIVVRVSKRAAPTPFTTTTREKLQATKTVWPIVVIFLIIIIGMYGGFFTPTEAAACGAFATFIVSLLLRKLDKRNIKSTILLTIKSTAMCYFILIGAYVFNRFMTISGLPTAFGSYIAGLAVPRFVILILIVIMYLIMGSLMDVFAILLLTLPIIFPVITALEYDPIWFGILMVRMVEVGLISPPFGINLFTIAKNTRVDIKVMYKGILPFLAADAIHIILLCAIPEIVTFLV